MTTKTFEFTVTANNTDFNVVVSVEKGDDILSAQLDPYIPQGGELAVYLAAVGGACLGFLWYNSHPAQVFMGDTGSLAIGGVIGMVAVLAKCELIRRGR